jgi:hypothetical protein
VSGGAEHVTYSGCFRNYRISEARGSVEDTEVFSSVGIQVCVAPGEPLTAALLLGLDRSDDHDANTCFSACTVELRLARDASGRF